MGAPRVLPDGRVIYDDAPSAYGAVASPQPGIQTHVASPQPVVQPQIETPQVVIQPQIETPQVVTPPAVYPEYHTKVEESRPTAPVSKTHLLGDVDGKDWTHEQIRDFVVEGIAEKVGAFPRNPVTEASIFKSFKSRYGELAGPIAIHAIDVCGGFWQDAPISVNRFCKKSDEWFGDIIAERISPTT